MPRWCRSIQGLHFWVVRDYRMWIRFTYSKIPWYLILTSFPFSLLSADDEAKLLKSFCHFMWDHKQSLLCDSFFFLSTCLPVSLPGHEWYQCSSIQGSGRDLTCFSFHSDLLWSPFFIRENWLTPTFSYDVFWDHDILKYLRSSLESSHPVRWSCGICGEVSLQSS